MLHNKVGFNLRRKKGPKFVPRIFASSSLPLTDDGDGLFLGHGLTTPLSDVPSPVQGTLCFSCTGYMASLGSDPKAKLLTCGTLK